MYARHENRMGKDIERLVEYFSYEKIVQKTWHDIQSDVVKHHVYVEHKHLLIDILANASSLNHMIIKETIEA